MLQNITKFYGKSLHASDGDIGHVKDFYFDDKTWAVRYLVVDTGKWLAGRMVLLPPNAFGSLHLKGENLPVNLTRHQIQNSPSIETHRPVSRQYEEEFYRYYGWPVYWQASEMMGMGGFPVVMPPLLKESTTKKASEKSADTHLRSAAAVRGYHIQALDGMIGEVTDFLLDAKSWAIRELVVEAGHWYSGKEIRIRPSKVDRISFEDSSVFVSLTKDDIQRSDPDQVVREEASIHGTGQFSD